MVTATNAILSEELHLTKNGISRHGFVATDNLLKDSNAKLLKRLSVSCALEDAKMLMKIVTNNIKLEYLGIDMHGINDDLHDDLRDGPSVHIHKIREVSHSKSSKRSDLQPNEL